MLRVAPPGTHSTCCTGTNVQILVCCSCCSSVAALLQLYCYKSANTGRPNTYACAVVLRVEESAAAGTKVTGVTGTTSTNTDAATLRCAWQSASIITAQRQQQTHAALDERADAAAAGTRYARFTRFTGTMVQILTSAQTPRGSSLTPCSTPRALQVLSLLALLAQKYQKCTNTDAENAAAAQTTRTAPKYYALSRRCAGSHAAGRRRCCRGMEGRGEKSGGGGVR